MSSGESGPFEEPSGREISRGRGMMNTQRVTRRKGIMKGRTYKSPSETPSRHRHSGGKERQEDVCDVERPKNKTNTGIMGREKLGGEEFRMRISFVFGVTDFVWVLSPTPEESAWRLCNFY